MDGAAKRIKLVAQRILPHEPHHLSLSPDRRYPEADAWQWRNSPLQYTTFLSDVDRGALLTRPYYDMREEPEPKLNALSAPRTEPKKALNKMSFKDYKRQKKASLSPTENGVPGKVDLKNNNSAGHGTPKDALRQEQSKVKEAGPQRESKAHEPRSNGEAEKSKSSLSKYHATNAPTPSSESKKRPVETEDGTRPQKRPRPDEPSRPEQLRNGARPETPRSREQHDSKSASRDGKSAAPHSTSSGRSALGILNGSHRAPSPKITVNGVKTLNSASNTTTPRKPDTSGKHLVPPLLSPLRLGIDEEHDSKSPRKRPAEMSSSGKSLPKSHKSDGPSKKGKSPSREVPPLLSPTLPPIIEEALARLQKTPSKGDSSSQRGSQASDSPTSARKPRPRTDDVGRPSKMVTMKYSKRVGKRIQMLWALPQPRSQRKERSMSPDDHPVSAKKRPRPPENNLEPSSTSSSKRLKTEKNTELSTSTSSKQLKAANHPSSKPPVTPLNSAVALSHVTSGASQTRTPGAQMASTPTSSVGVRPAAPDITVQARIAALKQRNDHYTILGTSIKRARDALAKRQTETGVHLDLKVQTAMTMEMVLAYMIAFKSLNQMRELERRPSDVRPWQQLRPFLDQLKQNTKESLPMHVLSLQLKGICTGEILESYEPMVVRGNWGPQDPRSLGEALKSHRNIWSSVEELQDKISDDAMKTYGIKVWSSPVTVANAALPILNRWAKREHVNWEAKITVPEEL